MNGSEIVPVGERRRDDAAALDSQLDQLGRDIAYLDRQTAALARHQIVQHIQHQPSSHRRTRRAEAIAAVLIAIIGQTLLAATISIGVNPVLAALTAAVFGVCGFALVAAMWMAQR